MKFKLLTLSCTFMMACGAANTPATTTTTSTNQSKPTVTTSEKTAALRATKAVNKLQRLGALSSKVGPGRDFAVTNPSTTTLDETLCGADASGGTLSGKIRETTVQGDETPTDFQSELSLTFKKCQVDGSTFDGGPFVQGVGYKLTNSGTDAEPSYQVTVELFIDGQVTVTGAEAGAYDFTDLHIKIGPIALELLDDSVDVGAETTTYNATISGSFKDGGETFTFDNDVIDLTESEIEESFPDEASEDPAAMAAR